VTELDQAALYSAHKAVEDVLVDLRDRRISVMGSGNGFVIREKDGKDSDVMRLGTREGLAIGIRAYLEAIKDR
jgi:hypothetical protein